MCIFHLFITMYVYNNLSFNPSFKQGSTTLEFQSVITVLKERRRSIVYRVGLQNCVVLFPQWKPFLAAMCKLLIHKVTPP